MANYEANNEAASVVANPSPIGGSDDRLLDRNGKLPIGRLYFRHWRRRRALSGTSRDV